VIEWKETDTNALIWRWEIRGRTQRVRRAGQQNGLAIHVQSKSKKMAKMGSKLKIGERKSMQGRVARKQDGGEGKDTEENGDGVKQIKQKNEQSIGYKEKGKGSYKNIIVKRIEYRERDERDRNQYQKD